jgi:hypothetical protein
MTNLLASPSTPAMQLAYRPDRGPDYQPSVTLAADQQTGPSTHTIPPGSASHQLITAQLLSAIEYRCSKLSKTVLNELEHRLLRRQQASRFATLLSAVILLNCVERMTAVYQIFDSKSETTSWPLHIPASTLWQQGPRFADLLVMLLRLRGLPPKTFKTQEGTLAVMQEVPSPGYESKPDVDEQTKFASAWLDPLKLSVDDLIARRDGDYPTKDNIEAQTWDLRFVSKVLLS